MQNATIYYKIRIERGEHINRVVDIKLTLTDFENEYLIVVALYEDYGISADTWGSEYYTVIERTIEVFNED